MPEVAAAVVANQPKVLAGAIDTAASDKAARFIETASAFHLPLVLHADKLGGLG
ncbi:MAG: carboxyl transferase domain-containing protein [Haloechinothrix sp.]